MRSIVSLFTALALVALTGCSFSNSSGSISDSSGSISDSISSPSKSISESSDGDDSDGGSEPAPETPADTASYQQDVSQLAVTYIKSGGELTAFTAGIAKLASARGITDWEADTVTAQAIGTGAGTAGLDEAAFNDFGDQLFGDDLTKLNELRIGYQQTAPPSAPAVAAPTAEEASETEGDAVSQPETQPGA